MRGRDESGAVAVLVAITASVLFMFGAFAVDLGAAYSERRADQNSADAAALGGANALPDMGGSTNDAMRDAGAYVEANLSEPEGGWDAAWAACEDPSHLALTGVRYGQCVSVSAYGTRVRVVIPTREVKTTLAAAMGIDSISVSALAEAQIEYEFSANVLPFGVPPSGATADETCLKSGPKGTAVLTETCDGSDQGNFGTLDFSHFGSAGQGTITQCRGETRDRLTRNIILGVDHPISTIATRPSLLADVDACEQGADHGSRPNGTATQTGGPDIQNALISGVQGDKNVRRDLAGRLAQTVDVAGWPMDSVQTNAPMLDNRPLWDLIDEGAAVAAGLPSCSPTTINSAGGVGVTDPADARRNAMVSCLAAARTTTTPIFTVDSDLDGVPDIAESRRFAFVPMIDQEFAKDALGNINGNKTVYFVRLVPVYLESLLWNQCASKDYIFRPDASDNLTRDGLPYTSLVPKNCKADGLTALILPEAALPSWVIQQGPGSRGTPKVVLYR